MKLDDLEKRLLDIIQTGFPLLPEPYRELARQLETTEEVVMEKIQKLLDAGIIRRLGGIFDSRSVGYTGTLCAMKVPEDKIDDVKETINQYAGVTHNYLRDHEYNMWFTLLAESREKIEQTLSQIKAETGIEEMLNLPALRIFKIKVNFNLQGDQDVNRERETNN